MSYVHCIYNFFVSSSLTLNIERIPRLTYNSTTYRWRAQVRSPWWWVHSRPLRSPQSSPGGSGCWPSQPPRLNKTINHSVTARTLKLHWSGLRSRSRVFLASRSHSRLKKNTSLRRLDPYNWAGSGSTSGNVDLETGSKKKIVINSDTNQPKLWEYNFF